MSLKMLIKKEKLYSLIWLVPFVALCLAISLVYSSNFNKGPVITLILNKADGLEEGKTAIKALSVEVGKIKKISLTPDLKSVKATVQMNLGTEELLKDDSVFWIQKPRIDRQGVSGLSTILSGYYIELKPGISEQSSDNFNVLEDPPIAIEDSSLLVTLESKSSKMVSEGDVVSFKGMFVGNVVAKQYDFNTGKLQYKVNIRKPFSSLVNKDTKFWISSGISVGMGADGLNIDTDSIESILKGGISFDNFIDSDVKLPPSTNGSVFNLYNNKNDIMINYAKNIDYIVFLKKPSKNLVVDSPVFYKGLQVGIVKKSPYFSKGFKLFKDSTDSAAVLISIQIERFDKNNERSVNELSADIDYLIKNKGLTANVETLNIITGRNYINLTEEKNHPDKKASLKHDKYDGYAVIPSFEKDISTLQQDITAFVHNLGTLPINELLYNINVLVKNSQRTSAEITALVANVDALVDNINKNDLSGEMLNTLKSLDKTLNSYSSDSEMYKELGKSLKSLNNTLKSIEPVVKKLDEKPDALIFSYDKEDPMPRKSTK